MLINERARRVYKVIAQRYNDIICKIKQADRARVWSTFNHIQLSISITYLHQTSFSADQLTFGSRDFLHLQEYYTTLNRLKRQGWTLSVCVPLPSVAVAAG